MTTYQTPVTDRTADDIVNQTAKAFFNVSDWLRIYNNTQVVNALVEFLLDIDIAFDALSTPTITTIPTVAQLNTLLLNIERIRLASGFPAIDGLTEIVTSWADGTSADAPTYIEANQWEQVLDTIYRSIARSVEYQPYCGVLGAGQSRLWQHRFRQYSEWVAYNPNPVRHARTGCAVAGTGLTRSDGFRRYS